MIIMFHGKYIFNPGPFSIAIVDGSENSQSQPPGLDGAKTM